MKYKRNFFGGKSTKVLLNSDFLFYTNRSFCSLPFFAAILAIIFCLNSPAVAVLNSETVCRLPNPILAIPSTDLEEPYNLIENGDFEKGLPQISLTSIGRCPVGAVSAVGQTDSQSARSGSQGYFIATGECKTSFMVRTYPDKAEKVTLTSWVRSRKDLVTVQPEIIFADAAGKLVFKKVGDQVTISENWRRVQFSASTSKGFNYADTGLGFPANCKLDIDDISVTVPVWREAIPVGSALTLGGVEVPQTPVAPILLRFSIHIEDPQALSNFEPYFLYKTTVIQEISRIFYENGGFLNVQPEIEWVLGAKNFAPDTLIRLAEDYNVTYSTHTHGPTCVDGSGYPYGASYCSLHPEYSQDINDGDVAEYVSIRRELLEEMSGTRVIDHNGNFDLVNKDLLYDEGIRILTGFKNKNTQSSYDCFIMNPWRPAAADALTDIDTFLEHDPERKLVYMPGISKAVSRHHFRIKEQIRRYLSQYINNADPNRVNTLHIILHVDSFTSSEGLSNAEYIQVLGKSPNFTFNFSDEFKQHLAYWNEMLKEVVKPLADSGYLQWATQQEMLEAYNSWESQCDSSSKPGSIITRIPNLAAGESGIAIKISVPESTRYHDGAPVAINVVGGFDGEGLNSTVAGLTEQGFIQIGFNLPGCGLNQNKSGGIYDYRGPDSVAALRDVALFALGRLPDINGKTLAELISPRLSLAGNVGIIGLSNGGNLALCATGIYADELKDLAWLVNWESPVGDGMPGGEAGSKRNSPLTNPAYNPVSGSWDLSSLAYDATLPVGSSPQNHLQGGLYFDLNHNHQVDPGTDFILHPLTFTDSSENPSSGTKVYYSERLTDYAFTHHLYPAARPFHLSSQRECDNFWHWRNGAKWISSLVAVNRGIHFLVIASEKDHVQTAADHPHILIQYDAFKEAGARFVRINPDASYISLLSAGDAGSDNDAGADFSRLSIRDALEPETISMTITVLAAACELADRARCSNNRRQIDLAVQGLDEIGSNEKVFTLEPNDYCLILVPKIPAGHKLYLGMIAPDDTVYTVNDLNQFEIFTAELPSWPGTPLILDTPASSATLPGDYTIYSLFVPEDREPLPVQDDDIIGKTILRFK